MRLNYFLGEKTFYFQFDKQIAFEGGENSNSVAMVEKIIQDGDGLECVVGT